MSTNKTENYQLHAWEPGDDFLLREINENFAAIDARAAYLVAGSYVGDGAAARLIELGFTPRAVVLTNSQGRTYNSGTVIGGIAAGGSSSSGLTLSEGGFTTTIATMNSNNSRYYFFALR